MVALVVPTGIVDVPRSVRNGVARKAARDARVAVTRNVAKAAIVARAAGTAIRIAVTATATAGGVVRTPGRDPGGKHYQTPTSPIFGRNTESINQPA